MIFFSNAAKIVTFARTPGLEAHISEYLDRNGDPNAWWVTRLSSEQSSIYIDGEKDLKDEHYSWLVLRVAEQSKNNEDAVNLLLDKGANPWVTNDLLPSGDIRKVSASHRGILDREDYDLLYYSCLNGWVKTTMRLLTEKPEKIEYKYGRSDMYSETPLELAFSGKNENLVAELLDRGARSNKVYEFGLTTLMKAVELGSPKLVRRLLLTNLHMINMKTHSCHTALTFAINEYPSYSFVDCEGDGFLTPASPSQVNEEIINILLEYGADPLVRTLEYGYKPNGDTFASMLLKANKLELLKKLSQQYPAMLDMKTGVSDQTLLHIAAIHSNEMTRFILEQRPQFLDLPDNQNTTPLMDAAANGQTENVRFLLQQGANPEIKGLCWADIRWYVMHCEYDLKDTSSALYKYASSVIDDPSFDRIQIQQSFLAQHGDALEAEMLKYGRPVRTAATLAQGVKNSAAIQALITDALRGEEAVRFASICRLQ